MSPAAQGLAANAPMVRPADRVLDVAAGALLAGGVGLFLFARQALKSLAGGTYALPDGVTWVSRAELHDLQSKVGLWVTTLGLLLSLLAFARHARRHWPTQSAERQVNW